MPSVLPAGGLAEPLPRAAGAVGGGRRGIPAPGQPDPHTWLEHTSLQRRPEPQGRPHFYKSSGSWAELYPP